MNYNDYQFTQEWNALHIKCCKENYKVGRTGEEAANYRNEIMADYLEDLLLRAKEAYYELSDFTLMTDNEFDKYESYLKLLRPGSPVLIKVGS